MTAVLSTEVHIYSQPQGQCLLASAPKESMKKRKEKEEYLYSAFYILCISQSAPAWITQFYLQIHHVCLSFVCVHQMAPPLTEVSDNPIVAYYLSIDPEGMKG